MRAIHEIDPHLCQGIVQEFIKEYERARVVFPRNWTSPHEGYGVIKEEFDEFWDDIKDNELDASRHEAIQTGAMILRYIVECCDAKDRKP